MQHALEKSIGHSGVANAYDRRLRKLHHQYLGHVTLARGIERIRCLRQEDSVRPMKQHAGKTKPLLLRRGEHAVPVFHHVKMPCPIAQTHPMQRSIDVVRHAHAQ